MALGRPAAGKTGTTNDSAAVWFCGYTPDLAGCAWAGDPRGGFKYKMSDIVINHVHYTPVYGASIPGPIWKSTFKGALSGTPATAFDLKPVITGNSGLKTESACTDTSTDCAEPVAPAVVSVSPTPTASGQ